MDETFSSTGAEEATTLAERYLETLRQQDCLCLFSTHLHGLAHRCADLPGYRTLSAEPGTYRVLSARPGGSSFAEQIAKSYGLL
jgi:DNA mismatch repair ATPase MutS